MNPFIKNENMANLGQLKALANNNPRALLEQMALNNPEIKNIINMLNQGISSESIFKNLCFQRGINPDEFIKNLK